jgi:hypoxanthine phosphoribosyltransferase
MIEKSWEEFYERLDEIEFGEYDLIVAVARGGIIPAGFIQQKLNVPMKIIQINYRDDTHTPRYDDAKLLETESFEITGKKLLLVDDVSKTGKTIEKAKEYLAGNEVTTCVFNGNADIWFYQSPTCLKMPWKR